MYDFVAERRLQVIYLPSSKEMSSIAMSLEYCLVVLAWKIIYDMINKRRLKVLSLKKHS